MNAPLTQKFPALDSLRGIAALTVMFGHYFRPLVTDEFKP